MVEIIISLKFKNIREGGGGGGVKSHLKCSEIYCCYVTLSYHDDYHVFLVHQ